MVPWAKNFHSQPLDPAEMYLVGGADQDPEIEMERDGGNGEIVRRDESAGTLEIRNQWGPVACRLNPEVDDRYSTDQGVDFFLPVRRPLGGVCKAHAD